MTVRVVLACGGVMHGDPCRQAIPTGVVPATGYTADLGPALKIAAAAGWRHAVDVDDELLLRCPACYRRDVERHTRPGGTLPAGARELLDRVAGRRPVTVTIDGTPTTVQPACSSSSTPLAMTVSRADREQQAVARARSLELAVDRGRIRR